MRSSFVSLVLPLVGLAGVCLSTQTVGPVSWKDRDTDELIEHGAVIQLSNNSYAADPPPHRQRVQREDPNYSIPPDTFAYLVSKPSSPRIGQPMIHVKLDRQIRKSHRTNETYAYYLLDFEARSFIHGKYEDARLYVGCKPPKLNETTTNDDDDVNWNFSYNCHIGHNHLDTKCDVPLMHLSYDRQKSTGCKRRGSDFACDSKIYVAFQAAVSKHSEDGTDTDFDLWGQGTCVKPEGKTTTRKKPLCDEQKETIAQYFEFEMDCDQKNDVTTTASTTAA